MKIWKIANTGMLLSVAGVAQSPPGAASTPAFTPAPTEVIVFVFAVMTLVLAAGIYGLRRLQYSTQWSFAGALSDGEKPSASRLIAFLGFMVMIAVILGIGYSSLWVFLKVGQLPTLSGATTFLLACAGLFAPYLANQLGGAIGGLMVNPPLGLVPSVNPAIPVAPQAAPNSLFGAPVPPL